MTIGKCNIAENARRRFNSALHGVSSSLANAHASSGVGGETAALAGSFRGRRRMVNLISAPVSYAVKHVSGVPALD